MRQLIDAKPPFLKITLSGHLTVVQLNTALAPVVNRVVPGAKVQLLFDCRAMTGYDTEARLRFVAWHKQMGQQLSRVAIVTTNPFWSVVISAMALASGRTMKPFVTPGAAERWLFTAPPHS